MTTFNIFLIVPVIALALSGVATIILMLASWRTRQPRLAVFGALLFGVCMAGVWLLPGWPTWHTQRPVRAPALVVHRPQILRNDNGPAEIVDTPEARRAVHEALRGTIREPLFGMVYTPQVQPSVAPAGEEGMKLVWPDDTHYFTHREIRGVLWSDPATFHDVSMDQLRHLGIDADVAIILPDGSEHDVGHLFAPPGKHSQIPLSFALPWSDSSLPASFDIVLRPPSKKGTPVGAQTGRRGAYWEGDMRIEGVLLWRPDEVGPVMRTWTLTPPMVNAVVDISPIAGFVPPRPDFELVFPTPVEDGEVELMNDAGM
ncbi:MAG: hypothetical protein ACR2GY_10050 [Phycisphaerales bacterium]